jgi:hypothetical protein
LCCDSHNWYLSSQDGIVSCIVLRQAQNGMQMHPTACPKDVGIEASIEYVTLKTRRYSQRQPRSSSAFRTCRISVKYRMLAPVLLRPIGTRLAMVLLPYAELTKDHIQDVLDVHHAGDLAYRPSSVA